MRRRERDSNPRYSFPYTGLANLRLQPLGHLSTRELPFKEPSGGAGRIRTYERLAPLAVFKTAAFNRSATHPSLEYQRPGSRALRTLGERTPHFTYDFTHAASGDVLSTLGWRPLQGLDTAGGGS